MREKGGRYLLAAMLLAGLVWAFLWSPAAAQREFYAVATPWVEQHSMLMDRLRARADVESATMCAGSDAAIHLEVYLRANLLEPLDPRVDEIANWVTDARPSWRVRLGVNSSGGRGGRAVREIRGFDPS